MSLFFLQIDFNNLPATPEDWEQLVYSFPVHIRVLVGIVVLFWFFIVLLFGVIIVSRIYKTGRQGKREFIRKRYQPVLSNILFDEDSGVADSDVKKHFHPNHLHKKYTRSILLDEILQLHQNFAGELAARLELLYRKLDFHQDSIKKLRHKRWYVKAKGIRELALMNIYESKNLIQPFIHSKNELLRMEARFALVRLANENHLEFLGRESRMLSAWDMANIHSMLLRLPKDVIPDFGQWYYSTNKSVVLFAIAMVGAFKQQANLQKTIDLAHENPDPDIQLASIKCLHELSSNKAEDKLQLVYSQSNDENIRQEVLKTIGSIGSNHSISFLSGVLETNRPTDEKILAAKGLLALGAGGLDALKKLRNANDEKVQVIINHAKDSRL